LPCLRRAASGEGFGLSINAIGGHKVHEAALTDVTNVETGAAGKRKHEDGHEQEKAVSPSASGRNKTRSQRPASFEFAYDLEMSGDFDDEGNEESRSRGPVQPQAYLAAPPP